MYDTLIFMKKNYIRIIGLFFIGLFLFACENPLKEEQKKERVLIFADDYLAETGRYVLYWDGKNEQRKYVEPGRYIVLLEIKDWQDQEYIVAEPGGKPQENNRARFEPGYWLSNDLETPFPDTFRVESGTNIPIVLSAPNRVKISIYKD